MLDHVLGIFIQVKKQWLTVTESMMNLKVKDFQSVPVVVSENMTVYDAIVHMFLEDVGTLFVVDHRSFLQGVLSRKDLLPNKYWHSKFKSNSSSYHYD